MEFGVPLSPSVALPRWMKTDTDHRSCPLSDSGLSETLYLAANLTGCGHFSDEFLWSSGLLLRLAVRRLVQAPDRGRLRYPCLRHPSIRPPGRTRGASAPQRQRAGITQGEIREALPDPCWSKSGTIIPQQGRAGVESQPGSLVWRGLLTDRMTNASGTVILTWILE